MITKRMTNARRAAEALDFCIVKSCQARCDGDEIPEGWAVISIIRRTGSPRMLQLEAALCPECADELFRELKPIRRTGSMVVT